MLGNVALTNNGGPMLPRPWRIVFVLTIGLTILTLVFIALRLRVTYVLQQQLDAYEAAQASGHADLDARLESLTKRLDDIERVLFGDVVPSIAAKTPTPPRPVAQPWRAEKEIRERLEALERWRLTHQDKRP